MERSFEEAAAVGLGGGELGFQPIAEGHQFLDFGDDAVLFGFWRQRNWNAVHLGLVHFRLCWSSNVRLQIDSVKVKLDEPQKLLRNAIEHMGLIIQPVLAASDKG